MYSEYTPIGTHATTVAKDEQQDFTVVTYHSTQVVKFDSQLIILNHGGWRTATTKTRMNQASSHFDLGYKVFQKDHKWYVDYRGETIPFQGDILKLDR